MAERWVINMDLSPILLLSLRDLAINFLGSFSSLEFFLNFPLFFFFHSFNLPRISARLERLMGTNVVKLTDRAYMKELRERIDEDYRKQLLSRIRAREVSYLPISTGLDNQISPEKDPWNSHKCDQFVLSAGNSIFIKLTGEKVWVLNKFCRQGESHVE